MANYEVKMPKMGESVQEATITNWFKKEGDMIEEEDVLLEIATDKVDSEIPSPVDGKLVKVLFDVDALVPVGETIAVINMDGEDAEVESSAKASNSEGSAPAAEQPKEEVPVKEAAASAPAADLGKSDKFYSPLVRSIAKEEGISLSDLDSIEGSGANGRVNKNDVLDFIKNGGAKSNSGATAKPSASAPVAASAASIQAPPVSAGAGDEIVEMDRMRKLISDHMVMSKHVSPHVTNFIEADVTNIVHWRNKVKEDFFKQEKQKITFTPIFAEAVAQALRDFPGVNVSVDGYNIIYRKNINVGIAVALPTGNLIVPVIKNADQKNLVGLTTEVNTLADKARNNALSPDDIQDGTFSISNFGSFKNLMGTPIINQPQAAILAVGNIEKKPAVLETPTGDVIAIRHKMFLSLTYDHRVIDGALGGGFLKKIADNLEQFDVNRPI